jgi:hypothetical protein
MMAMASPGQASSERKTAMLTKRSHYLAIGAILAASVGGGLYWVKRSSAALSGEYNPAINPQDFVSEINNKYFTLKPGAKFTYRNAAGTERIEHTVTNETKTLMGVTTRGLRVTEWLNGRLKEDTMDWYAQDKAGNVWYFGEAVNNYKDGKLIHHTGSWEAGLNGAKPGIIMPANPRVGETYRQEFHKGVAEDMGTIVATDQKVSVPFGTFENCLQIKDSSLLSTTIEHKYYCPAVGYVALEKSGTGTVLEELVEISPK